MGDGRAERCVAVTGCAGYVGSLVCSNLLRKGYKVRGLDSLLHGGNAVLGLYQHENFRFINGDIRDERLLIEALDGTDAVVHLAAIVGDPACARQPELARSVNLEGSLRLLKLSEERGVKHLIFASTCSNYGRMADPTQYACEESPLAPLSLYAETKVTMEKALLGYGGDHPAITVLRFATVFGVSPRMRFDLTVNEFALELQTKRKLVIFGEQFWRPYVHVRDAASAVVLALESPMEKVRGQVFNVGDTNHNYQKKQIVDLVRSQIPGSVDIQMVRKNEDPRDYRVSFEKIRRELNFRITIPIEAGIREVLDIIRQKVIVNFEDVCYRN
jgi:nucleoside-diphosphate-sugar epimerase